MTPRPRRPGESQEAYREAIRRAEEAWRRGIFPRRPRRPQPRRGQDLVDHRVKNTLGNEMAEISRLGGNIARFSQKFQEDFRKKNMPQSVAKEKYMQKWWRENEGNLQQASRNPAHQAKMAQFQKGIGAELRTMKARTNTAILRKFKDILPTYDRLQDRVNKHKATVAQEVASTDPQYAHELRYMNRFKEQDEANWKKHQESRKKFLAWTKQNDPSYYKRHQRFTKKHGFDPDDRRQQRYSSHLVNRDDINLMRRKAWDRYQKAQQPKKPTPKPPVQMPGGWLGIQAPPVQTIGPRPERPNMVVEKFGPAYRDAVQKQFADAARKNAEKQRKAQSNKQLKSFYSQLGTPAPRKKPRYNQAAYLAGLQSAPMMTMGQKMKPQQGIYKPYAKGGGVRKPKYNKKG